MKIEELKKIYEWLKEHYHKCTFDDECECGEKFTNWTTLNSETGEADGYWCTICAIKKLLQDQKDGDGYVIAMLEKDLAQKNMKGRDGNYIQI